MVDSTLVAGSKTVTFRAEDRYSLSRQLFKSKENAYPDGEGVLGSGGHSMGKITISAHLITVSGGDSADKQLWDDLDEIVKSNTDRATVATMTIILATGNLVLTGWCTGFSADRDAPDGIAHVPFTLDFLIKTKNTAALT